jgi:hypothetical protein
MRLQVRLSSKNQNLDEKSEVVERDGRERGVAEGGEHDGVRDRGGEVGEGDDRGGEAVARDEAARQLGHRDEVADAGAGDQHHARPRLLPCGGGRAVRRLHQFFDRLFSPPQTTELVTSVCLNELEWEEVQVQPTTSAKMISNFSPRSQEVQVATSANVWFST